MPFKENQSKKEAIELYQVGDVFTTTRSGNPSALLGYGTWTEVYGVLYGTTGTNAKIATGDGVIARANLPDVGLSFSATTSTDGNHTHGYIKSQANDRTWAVDSWSGSDPRGNSNPSTSAAGNHSHTISGTTASMNGNVAQTEFLPKGIYVYHWLRLT
jgi:hypothetical protein